MYPSHCQIPSLLSLTGDCGTSVERGRVKQAAGAATKGHETIVGPCSYCLFHSGAHRVSLSRWQTRSASVLLRCFVLVLRYGYTLCTTMLLAHTSMHYVIFMDGPLGQ